MARTGNWVPGFFHDVHLIVGNPRHAIMFRYICRQHCEISTNENIYESLADITTYPSNCICSAEAECSFCDEFGSRIGVGSSLDSSDSVFSLSSCWSEDSIEIASAGGTSICFDSPSPILSSQSVGDDNDVTSESDIEVPRQSDNALTIPSLHLKFSSDEGDSQCISDSPRQVPLVSFSPDLFSDLDEDDSQQFLGSEGIQPSFQAVDPSFSDAETQWPSNLLCPVPDESDGPEISLTKAEESADSKEDPFLCFDRQQEREKKRCYDSDSSSNSVSLLKRRK